MTDPNFEDKDTFADLVEHGLEFLTDPIDFGSFGTLALSESDPASGFSNIKFDNDEYGIALRQSELIQFIHLANEFYRFTPTTLWFLRFQVASDCVIVEGDHSRGYFRYHLQAQPFHWSESKAAKQFILSLAELEAALLAVEDSALIKIGAQGSAQFFSKNFRRPLQLYPSSKFGARFLKAHQTTVPQPPIALKESASLGQALALLNGIFNRIDQLDDRIRFAHLKNRTLFAGTRLVHLHLSCDRFDDVELIIPRFEIDPTSTVLRETDNFNVAKNASVTKISSSVAELAFDSPGYDVTAIIPSKIPEFGFRFSKSELFDFVKQGTAVFANNAVLSIRPYVAATDLGEFELELSSFDLDDRRSISTVIRTRPIREESSQHNLGPEQFESEVLCRSLLAVLHRDESLSITLGKQADNLQAFLTLPGEIETVATFVKPNKELLNELNANI